MSSKLPWATVAVIIVVAAIGAWALYGPAGEVPVGHATITGIVGPGTVFADDVPAGTASGVENVYIVDNDHAAGYEDNFSGNENILDVIESDTDSVDIVYETRFQIVVAVKVGTDNMAYVRIDNMNIGLGAYGSFSITDENAGGSSASYMATWSHENSGSDTNDGWLRINAIWDNDGNGYVLPASGTLNLENINLWGWGS